MRMRLPPRQNAMAWVCVVLHSFVMTSSMEFVAARGGEPDSKAQAARDTFFEQNVRPLLAENCYSCHGDKKQKGGLRLDSLEAILKGGESGPAVVPGKPDESLLVEAINYDGLEMPPTASWPEQGRHPHAVGLAGCPLARPRSRGTRPDRRRWNVRPIGAHLRRPRFLVAATAPQTDRARRSRPAVRSDWSDWSRNPIDRFILKGSLDHGLTPAPEADKATLIRRATFDLTGLPPTLEEVDAFLADDAPGCLRAADRSPAGIAALRPAMGAALARPGPLRRVGRLPPGRRSRPMPGVIATMSSARSTAINPTTAS